jgi:hypothetical protein
MRLIMSAIRSRNVSADTDCQNSPVQSLAMSKATGPSPSAGGRWALGAGDFVGDTRQELWVTVYFH